LIEQHFQTSLKKWVYLSEKENSDQYIVKYLSSFADQGYLYFLFQYRQTVVFEDLYNDLIYGKQTVPFSLTYEFQKNTLYDLIKGLRFMHSYQISHGNVQPKSLWYSVTENHPYWVDFGFQVPTSMFYVSPELAQILTDRYHNKMQGFNDFIKDSQKQMASDVWGLGCLVYYIITGQHVIDHNSNDLQIWDSLSKLLTSGKNIDLDFDKTLIRLPNQLDKWKQFIMWVLHSQWTQRPTIDDIVVRFEDDLLSS